MAANMSYLLAPVSHAISIRVDEEQSYLSAADVDILMDAYNEELREDTAVRFMEERGAPGNRSYTFRQAKDRLFDRVHPEESYRQRLTNDFPLVTMDGELDESVFNQLHDPTPIMKKRNKTDPDPVRIGFCRQQTVICGQGYACTLHTQYPAFLPRLYIPLFGKVREVLQ